MQREARGSVAKSKGAKPERLIALALCFAILFGWLVASVYVASGATYTQTVTFSENDLRFSKVGAYDLGSIQGARWLDQPGMPHLPQVPVRVALPAGSKVVGVSIVACDSITLPGLYVIWPSQPPQPLSAPRRAEFVPPVASVYMSREPYPHRAVELAGSGKISGVPICDVIVFPLRYLPLDRKLMLYTEIKFRLDYETPETQSAQEVASPHALGLVRRLVGNQAGPLRSSERAIYDLVPMGGGEVNYLIITSEGLKASFEPLRQWKMRKGLVSEIVTKEGIASAYPGSDLQEKIRNCIKYFRTNRGTDWVLLGGSTQIIPDRKAYVALSDKPYIPCDLYYSDLDGTWNDDADLYWGEASSDNVDMYADVFVGRAPVATAEEVDTFVKKVLTYEGFYPLPRDYELTMVFVGEILWGDPMDPSDPDYTDAGIAKNLVGSRYVPPRFSIEKLYQSSGNLTYATVISALDQGTGFVNICCHGFYKNISLYEDFLQNEDFLMLTSNERYGLMYSASCLSGGFDQNDCIGEAWVLAKRGGGFYIGNSRYGWGTPGSPGDGPSDYYDQSFFESVFVTGFTNLGKAHADAKHEYVGESRADPYMRYLMYGLNLLGDPELPLWTEEPREMEVFAPSALDTTPQVYGVSVSSGGAPLAGAKVCLWKPDEVYVVGETDPSGSVSLIVDALTPGALHVTVTCPNVIPYVGEALVASGPPHPAAPAGLVASEGEGPCVRLTWASVADPDLSSYKIYRNTSEAPQTYCVVPAPETTCTDTAVAAGNTYYYWVTGFDSLGHESPFSQVASVHIDGNVSVPDGGHRPSPSIAINPNPFMTSVRIVLETLYNASPQVEIFDVDGRRVSAPRLDEVSTGVWEATWKGEDASGRRVSPGIYFVKFTSGPVVQTRKVIVLE